MPNLFEKWSRGNTDRADFKKSDLPSNRLELFFNVLVVRFWKLMQLNLIALVALLPAAVCTMLFLLLLTETTADTSGAITPQVTYDLFFYYLLAMIPLLTLAGPGLAGMMRVLRDWARDKNAWVWQDFKEGMKANWKQSLVVMFINSLVLFAGFFAYTFYVQMAGQGLFFKVAEITLYVLLVLFALINLYLFPLMVQFKLKLRQLYNNAILIAVARLPFSILTLIGLLLPIFLFALLGVPVLFAYMGLFGIAFNGLILASYTNACFDKIIFSQMKDGDIPATGLREKRKDDD